MFGEPKNYYEILGLTPEATAEDIRRAYVRLARLNHPDHNHNVDNGQMVELNHVYEILCDPQKRQQYDTTVFPGKLYDFTKTKVNTHKSD